MKQTLILTLLFCLQPFTNQATPVTLPEKKKLEKALCNSGYRALVEQTPLVDELARKTLSAAAIHTIVQRASEVLGAKNYIPLTPEMICEHTPAVTAIVLQESPDALEELALLKMLNAIALQKLARLPGFDRKHVENLRQIQTQF